MRPTPDFLIVGASKSGSTWLSGCLQDHPEVYIPYGPTIDFFGRFYNKGLEWYEAHFRKYGG